jgi:hypothetical protein
MAALFPFGLLFAAHAQTHSRRVGRIDFLPFAIAVPFATRPALY